jgi:hypothetical protein
MERLAITDVQPGMQAFVDLRIYDGQKSAWFNRLNLPMKTKPYIIRVNCTACSVMFVGTIPFFPPNHSKHTLWFSAFDLMAFVYMEWPYFSTVLLNESKRAKFPQILDDSD